MNENEIKEPTLPANVKYTDVDQLPDLTQDPPTKASKLYNSLLSEGYTTKNLGKEDEFTAALSDSTKADKIYSGLMADGYTEKNLGKKDEFMSTFVQKKNASGNDYSFDKVLPENVGNTAKATPEETDPISLSNKAYKLANTKKQVTLPSGGFAMGTDATKEVPDEEAVKQADKINEDLKARDYDPKQLTRLFHDFPEELYSVPGLTKPELLQKIKDNPENAERYISAAKWQTSLATTANKLQQENPTIDLNPIKNTILKSANDVNYADKRKDNAVIVNFINTNLSGEEKDKALENLSADRSFSYGQQAAENQAGLQKDPLNKVLNTDQIAAYNYIQDLHPEQADGFATAFVDPKEIKDNTEAKIGREEKLKKLDEIGIDLKVNYAKEKLAPLKTEYEALVNASQERQLTPDELKRAQYLETTGAKYYHVIERGADQREQLLQKYPNAGYLDAGNVAQEFLGQEHGFLSHVALEAGKATGNTINGVINFVKEPFLSDKESQINQLQILGDSKLAEKSTHLTQENQLLQSFKQTVGKELQSDIDKIKNDKFLNDTEKRTQVTDLLMTRPTEWQRTPIEGGKSNIGLTSLMYGVGDMAANLAPFVLMEGVTGGGATASAARKFTSLFTSAAATSFQETYAASIENGEANPYAHAMRVTAVNSFAMAGADAPAAIRKMAGTQKTAIGDLVSKMTDKEIQTALRSEPSAFSALKKAYNIGDKIATSTIESGKSAAKITAFTTGGTIANDIIDGNIKAPEDYAKQAGISALNFTIFGAATGLAGKVNEKVTDINKAALYTAGRDPIAFNEALDQQIKNRAITPEDAIQVRANIEKANDIIKKVPFVDAKGNPLSEKSKRDLMFLKMQETDLETHISNDLPKDLQITMEKRLADTHDKMDKLYKGTLIDTPAQTKLSQPIERLNEQGVPIPQGEAAKQDNNVLKKENETIADPVNKPVQQPTAEQEQQGVEKPAPALLEKNPNEEIKEPSELTPEENTIAVSKIKPKLADTIVSEGITSDNIDNFEYVINFLHSPEDFKIIKKYLNDTRQSVGEPKGDEQQGAGIPNDKTTGLEGTPAQQAADIEGEQPVSYGSPGEQGVEGEIDPGSKDSYKAIQAKTVDEITESENNFTRNLDTAIQDEKNYSNQDLKSIINDDTDLKGQPKEKWMSLANGLIQRHDIKAAIDRGEFQKAISEERMSTEDARTIIDHAGYEVPEDIFKKGETINAVDNTIPHEIFKSNPAVKDELKKRVDDFFESIKIKSDGKLFALPIPPALYNKFLDVIKESVKKGIDIYESIKNGIEFLRQNNVSETDLKDAETHFLNTSNLPEKAENDKIRNMTRTQVKSIMEAQRKSHSMRTEIKNSKLVSASIQAAREIAKAINPFLLDKTGEAREAAMIIRLNKGEEAQQNVVADEASNKLLSFFNKQKRADNVGFMLSIEDPEKFGHNTGDLKEIANQYRKRLDQAHELISRIKDVNFVEDYFPHFWRRPEEAKNILGKLKGRKPLEGTKYFLKERFYKNIMEGLENGLQLITYNPEEITRIAETNALRLYTAHQIKSDLVAGKLIKFFRPSDAPKDFVKLNDPLFRPIEEGGTYYAPEPVAAIINNFTSKGLFDAAGTVGNVSRAIRKYNNVKNLVQLGIGFFHFTTTSLDATVTGVANAMSKITAGKSSGIPDLLKSITVLPNLFSTIKIGDSAIKNYKKGIVSKEVDDLVQSGARVQMQKMYSVDAYYNAKKAFQNYKADGYLSDAGKGLWNSVFVIPELISQPLMQWFVPRLKAGSYLQTLRTELELKPDMNENELLKTKQMVWSAMDQRLGQYVYDNLFWNKTVKDLGFMSIRSLGWNAGTWMAFGKGVAGIPESGKRLVKGKGLDPHTAWLISLPVLVGLYGAMYQKMMTGQDPDEMKDYFFPKDGTTNPDGSPHRVSLPSYVKDAASYAKHPLNTMSHKASPFLNDFIETVKNKDFFHKKIIDPNDPIYKQGLEYLEYQAKSFVPFSLRNVTDQSKGIEQFFGITPASKDFQKQTKPTTNK